MKIFALTFLFLITVLSFSAKAQKNNYFYTTLNAPIGDLIEAALSSNTNDNKKDFDGILFNAGYAIAVYPQYYPQFFIEAGIDYLDANKLETRNYENPLTLVNSVTTYNSSFSFQVRPTFKVSIDADDETFFSVGLGVNLQRIFSSGTYSTFASDRSLISSTNDKSKSDFFLNVQPKVGFSFKTNQSVQYYFGLTYSQVNWNRSEKNLRLEGFNQPIPSHKSYTLFVSGGFTF